MPAENRDAFGRRGRIVEEVLVEPTITILVPWTQQFGLAYQQFVNGGYASYGGLGGGYGGLGGLGGLGGGYGGLGGGLGGLGGGYGGLGGYGGGLPLGGGGLGGYGALPGYPIGFGVTSY